MDQEKDGGKLMESQAAAATTNGNYLKRIDVTMDENKTAGRYLFNIDH